MAMEALFVLVGALIAVVAYAIGVRIGRSSGSRTGLAAAATAEERLREQARVHSRDAALHQSSQNRLLDLIVNLPETVNGMGAARSTSALCRITVRALMDLVGARKVGLFIASGSPPTFKLEVFAGDPRPSTKAVFELGSGKLGRLAELIGVRTLSDLTFGTANDDPSPADELFTPDLCISIRRHERIYAFVAMDGVRRGDPMTRRIVQMLSDIHAVSAEGLSILHKERLKADIDQLTGLFNRRHLDRRLAEEMARAQSYGTKLSVFLFDIDNFKNYNDSNGHQAGDECLQQVAALARSTTRGSDIVCRYGGEEFLVILLGANADEASHHAERIRRTIATADIAHGAGQPLGCVSISGGVASYPYDATQPTTLIELADKALYSAKESGRNRVVRASDLIESGTSPSKSASEAAPTQRSSDELVPTSPSSFAPMLSRSVMHTLSSSLRAPEPVHTPIPRRVTCGNDGRYRVSADADAPPSRTPVVRNANDGGNQGGRTHRNGLDSSDRPKGTYSVRDDTD